MPTDTEGLTSMAPATEVMASSPSWRKSPSKARLSPTTAPAASRTTDTKGWSRTQSKSLTRLNPAASTRLPR